MSGQARLDSGPAAARRLVVMSSRSGSAFARGFRDGLRSVLAVGGHRPYLPYVRRQIGSPATDARVRAMDAERVAADMRQHEPIG